MKTITVSVRVTSKIPCQAFLARWVDLVSSQVSLEEAKADRDQSENRRGISREEDSQMAWIPMLLYMTNLIFTKLMLPRGWSNQRLWVVIASSSSSVCLPQSYVGSSVSTSIPGLTDLGSGIMTSHMYLLQWNYHMLNLMPLSGWLSGKAYCKLLIKELHLNLESSFVVVVFQLPLFLKLVRVCVGTEKCSEKSWSKSSTRILPQTRMEIYLCCSMKKSLPFSMKRESRKCYKW